MRRTRITLIKEKVKQAAELLREFGVDCWITFTRESEICGDPTLVFLAPGPVTWRSAFIVGAGYAEFPHALGHQVGRFAHDGTALLGPGWEKYAQKPFKKLEEGMVFTIEPRLTVPGRGVVTIEEMVVVTKDGADWMGRPQRDIFLVK